jgi:hypothetical protein
MNDYLTYKKSNSIDELAEIKNLLDNNNIENIIEESSSSVDLTFSGGNIFDKEIRLKIRPSDFEIADKLLEEQAKNAIYEIDQDHYLLEFTDQELLEIIGKPDEWSKTDFISAQKILKSRGVEISQEKIDHLKKERIATLSTPEKGNAGWIALGYITALLGGLLGIFIGWHLLSFKKTLPNGQRVYEYDINSRKHGQIILIIGIVCLAISIFYELIQIR